MKYLETSKLSRRNFDKLHSTGNFYEGYLVEKLFSLLKDTEAQLTRKISWKFQLFNRCEIPKKFLARVSNPRTHAEEISLSSRPRGEYFACSGHIAMPIFIDGEAMATTCCYKHF